MADQNDENDQTVPLGATKVKVTILDSIVGINSLFTAVVFLGLTFSPSQQSIDTKPHCEAGTHITKLLVLFEVISFSCFLLSSIVAKGLNMAIVVFNANDTKQSSHAFINLSLLTFGMGLSGFGSVVGCVFLITSIVMVIQIRLGVLSCGGLTKVAVAIMCVMVPFGLLVYICIAACANWKKVSDCFRNKIYAVVKFFFCEGAAKHVCGER